jgi:hypothetical protein
MEFFCASASALTVQHGSLDDDVLSQRAPKEMTEFLSPLHLSCLVEEARWRAIGLKRGCGRNRAVVVGGHVKATKAFGPRLDFIAKERGSDQAMIKAIYVCRGGMPARET